MELVSFRVGQETAVMAASMEGMDGFVFTGGIGEHAVSASAMVCARLSWLGIELESAANAESTSRISTADGRVDVRVIPTDEEAMIARHTRDLIA